MAELENDAYAFPGQRIAKNGLNLGHGQGMTLRDWFAASWVSAGNHGNLSPEYAADKAYEFADAMIARRNV